jgi:hypothetical protein
MHTRHFVIRGNSRSPYFVVICRYWGKSWTSHTRVKVQWPAVTCHRQKPVKHCNHRSSNKMTCHCFALLHQWTYFFKTDKYWLLDLYHYNYRVKRWYTVTNDTTHILPFAFLSPFSANLPHTQPRHTTWHLYTEPCFSLLSRPVVHIDDSYRILHYGPDVILWARS